MRNGAPRADTRAESRAVDGLMKENQYLRDCWEEAHKRHVRLLKTSSLRALLAFIVGFLMSTVWWMLLP